MAFVNRDRHGSSFAASMAAQKEILLTHNKSEKSGESFCCREHERCLWALPLSEYANQKSLRDKIQHSVEGEQIGIADQRILTN